MDAEAKGGQCRTRTCDLLLVRQAPHHGPFNNRDYSNASITENTCLSDPGRIVRAIVFAVTRGSLEF
jgi:hypothetical protein